MKDVGSCREEQSLKAQGSWFYREGGILGSMEWRILNLGHLELVCLGQW